VEHVNCHIAADCNVIKILSLHGIWIMTSTSVTC